MNRPTTEYGTTTMSGRTFAAILLVIILGIGATALGVTAYNAGVTAGLAQNVAAEGGSVVVAPGYAAAPYVGWGWGPGFGFFGFFAFLFFLFIVFGLIRAVFGWGRWGRRDRGGYGPGGYGRGWDDRDGRDAWNDRVREVHDELHRTGGTAAPGGRRRQRRDRPERPGRAGRSPADPPPHRRPGAVPRAPSLLHAPASATEAGASASLLYDANAMKTILVVDDEPKIAALARDYLEHAGLRGRRRARRPGGARGGRSGAIPTSSSSTSGCPRSTASTSPA